MDIYVTLRDELKVEKWQVEAAVKLIDEGCTIPFISRYRKEATGSLNDEQLRDLHERLVYLRNLEEKKEQVLGSIEEQGKLTQELREKILAAQTLVVVEDLYRPYRPKRKTRASVARQKGLEGLAEYILAQQADRPVAEEAARYVTGEDAEEERRVKTPEEAVQGAKDIIAEDISDNADYRSYIREATVEEGVIAGGAGQGLGQFPRLLRGGFQHVEFDQLPGGEGVVHLLHQLVPDAPLPHLEDGLGVGGDALQRRPLFGSQQNISPFMNTGSYFLSSSRTWSFRRALPRWLMRSFSSPGMEAKLPPSTRKRGS